MPKEAKPSSISVGRTKGQKKSLVTPREYINNPAIHRLLKMSGGQKISSEGIVALRTYIYKTLDKILNTTRSFTEHARRKTITCDDFVQALKTLGKNYYAYDGKFSDLTICKSKEDMKKARKSGGCECVFIAPGSFKNLLLSRLNEDISDNSLKLTQHFRINLQMYLESEIIQKLSAASQLAYQIGGRVTIQPKDLNFVVSYGCSTTPECELVRITPPKKKKVPRKKKVTTIDVSTKPKKETKKSTT
jgi:histone H4